MTIDSHNGNEFTFLTESKRPLTYKIGNSAKEFYRNNPGSEDSDYFTCRQMAWAIRGPELSKEEVAFKTGAKWDHKVKRFKGTVTRRWENDAPLREDVIRAMAKSRAKMEETTDAQHYAFSVQFGEDCPLPKLVRKVA